MNIFFDFIIMILLYFLCFFMKWKNKGKRIFLIHTLIYIYIVFVFYFTLMPFVIPIPGGNNLFMESANLIPFSDLLNQRKGAILQIVLNVFMFVPFGFLLSIRRNKKFVNIIFYSFFFSLFIETIQLLYVWSGSITYRIFDVTDLITNTFGGGSGIVIYLMLKQYYIGMDNI